MAELWKAWKTKPWFPTLPPDPWESRKTCEIPTFPQPRRFFFYSRFKIKNNERKSKSDFLSSMSHELRSPLNAILGFAQLMSSDTPPPTAAQKANIDPILHAGWYLLELINEILDLAQVESGKLALSLEPISLAEIMFECQSMIEPQGRKRGIRMTFPVFDVPCVVDADRTRLKQVLIFGAN